jgi:hypothetical protein
MFFSSRPMARKFAQKLGCAAGTCLVLLGLSSAPAFAGSLTEAVSATPGVCPNQSFSQPFTALGDYSYYTLVSGSEFNSPPEGWELHGGAHVVSVTKPDGSNGSALDLPSGSVAVSAPVCVTLLYPSARIYTRTLEGKAGVAVSVSYAETKSEIKPRQVGETKNTLGAWEASEAFSVLPQLTGKGEEAREVRFVFTAGGNNTSTLLYGLYVDPWMR